jgi:hypothetical protein
VGFSYQRDDARRQVTTVMSGTVTEGDLLAIIERQAAEGTWRYKLLFDERGSRPEIRAESASIAREWQPFGERQPHQVDIFDDPDVAQYWLDAAEADDRR